MLNTSRKRNGLKTPRIVRCVPLWSAMRLLIGGWVYHFPHVLPLVSFPHLILAAFSCALPIHTPAAVNHQEAVENPVVFFDIQVGGQDVGRIKIELFADSCPKTAENFRSVVPKKLCCRARRRHNSCPFLRGLTLPATA
jgi:hypothetical protein